MAHMDVFNQDAFTLQSMLRAIEKVPYRPTLLGTLNIFEPVPIRTEAVSIEKREGVLTIVQTSNRGAPLDQRVNEKADIRWFSTVRIAEGDRINASEVQSIRAFGTESELMQVQAEVARRLAGPTGVMRKIELTWEHMRLGGVQGVVIDADGSTIRNWYTEFGIVQATEIDFELDDAATNVRGKCHAVVRAMQRAAKGGWVDGMTEAHALAGDAFFDALVDHAHVRDTYLNWAAAENLRQGMAFRAFTFGDITWHNYRGHDDFTSQAAAGEAGFGIDTDEAKFFPVNAPGVFQWAQSPGEFLPVVNTPGRPIYPLVVPDPTVRQAYVDVEAYSYPLFVCTRPDMLQRARRA